MVAPPARTEICDAYPAPSNAVARAGFGKLYDYVVALLGATGTPADARAALGAAKSGSNADMTSASALTGVGNGRGTDITISAAGAVTKPLQPCFSALVSANIANVTGDGTAYTVLFDAETFDVAANYAPGTGIFTAPVTGKYNFGGMLYVYSLIAGTTRVTIEIITSNRTYLCCDTTTYGGYLVLPFGFPSIDMDAGDTAYVRLTVLGTTKTIAIGGSYSRFAGHLVC